MNFLSTLFIVDLYMFKTPSILYILLFFSSVVFSQNHSGEILYGQRVKEMYGDTASIDNPDLKNIVVERFKEKQKALSPDKNFYSLKFQDHKSVFERLNTMNNDGSHKVTKELAKGIYFVNTVDKSIYHKGNFMGENLIMYYEKPSYDEWQIKNEQKEILGYNCIKAETIRRNEIDKKSKVTAWFTIDINLNFGPKNYFGLPGLIMELQEFGNVFYVREINIKEVRLDEVDKKDKEIITYQEYVKKVGGSIQF